MTLIRGRLSAAATKRKGSKMSSTAFEGRSQIGGNGGGWKGAEQRVDACARATRVSHWSCQASIGFAYLPPSHPTPSLPPSLFLQLCWVSFLCNDTLAGDSARRVLIRHGQRLFGGFVLLPRGEEGAGWMHQFSHFRFQVKNENNHNMEYEIYLGDLWMNCDCERNWLDRAVLYSYRDKPTVQILYIVYSKVY